MSGAEGSEEGIEVWPIQPAELEHLVLRCWPTEREELDALFAEQGTIGMAAWQGQKCVGVLHCYRVELPDGGPQGGNEHWPQWNNWWADRQEFFRHGDGWDRCARRLKLNGPGWCHACCHVGRTQDAGRGRSDGDGIRAGLDEAYFGRGIGTALCRASVGWAEEHGYSAVLAPGAPGGVFEYAVWAGHLPWTTYAKLGFGVAEERPATADLPHWARGNCPPEVMEQVSAALASGRPAWDLHERLMVMRLQDGRPAEAPSIRARMEKLLGKGPPS